jgi:hypothetical protein
MMVLTSMVTPREHQTKPICKPLVEKLPDQNANNK